MDWAIHQPEVRFDIRAERAECEYLFTHRARVLQDRLVRCGGGDRTKEIPVPEWEQVLRQEAQARRLLHQARVLGWGKEKNYYYAHKAVGRSMSRTMSGSYQQVVST
jgi:hypothetical protein